MLTKLAIACSGALLSLAAQAAPRAFNIPAGDLKAAIEAYVAQCDCQLVYKVDDLKGHASKGVQGSFEADAALDKLLEGSGLKILRSPNGVVLVAGAHHVFTDEELQRLDVVLVRGQNLHLGDLARTGTRMDIDPMELPQSVTSVSQDVLAHQQAKSLRDALSNFAGISDQTGQGSYAMRGFYAAIARNGDVQSSAQSFDAPLMTISRVEVVKGPDAIVAGLSAGYGGVINVISKTPEPRKILEVASSIGSRGYYDVGVDANTPVTEDKSLLVRLVADKQGAGTTWDGLPGASKKYLGPSATWRSKALGAELTLSYEYQSGNEPPRLQVFTDTDRLPSDAPPLHIPPDRQFADQTSKIMTIGGKKKLFDRWSVDFKYSDNHQTFNTVVAAAYLGSLFGLSDQQVLSTTSAVDGTARTKTGKLELNGEFETGPVEHKVLLAYDDMRQIYDFYGSTLSLYTVDIASGKATDASATLGPMLGYRTLPGKRSGSDSISYEKGLLALDHFVIGNWAGNIGLRRIHYEPDVAKKGRTFDATLPSLGLVYRWSPTLSLYGSGAKGFSSNSGMFQFDGTQVQPQDAVQTEVGFKALFAQSTIALTGALFSIDQHNVAVTDPQHKSGCVNGSCYISVSGVKSTGTDIELSGQLTRHLDLRVGYAYVDKKVSASKSAGIYYAHNTGNLWATWRFDGEPNRGAWAALGLMGRGKRNDDGFSAANPGNLRVDMNAGYDAKQWSLVGGVKNAFGRSLYTVESGFFGTGYLQQQREFYFTGRYSFY
ncbi:TonB-dependent receptor [Pelomonas sp. KK5]|uniref:TonB-dependent siderophore receptor n=1 Tax=Pelomonas sp. KK5 TaxID=1855730 RepID=UPI00097C9C6D|nr:TonB-dependent receptor [Pelomonas sp. KK5]